jgi:hypothetical protein
MRRVQPHEQHAVFPAAWVGEMRAHVGHGRGGNADARVAAQVGSIAQPERDTRSVHRGRDA